MTLRLGVIAEDQSDIDVIEAVIKKIIPNKKFAIRKFLGHGCGKIRAKCRQWARHLKLLGCDVLIVVHDLDQKVLVQLSVQLREALNPCPINKNVVVIPIREMEAWLLSDERAIQRVFNLPHLRKIGNPEVLLDPKRILRDIVFLRSQKKKYYLSTVHNGKIAREAELIALRRCMSFRPLENFARNNL